MSMIEKKTEKDYQRDAEYDVDTLIRAQGILDDPKKKKYALAEIQKRNAATAKAAAQLVAKTESRMKKVMG